MDVSRRAVVRALLRTVFTYSTMIAVYLTLNSITHPRTMTMRLVHFFNWPTEGSVLTFALVCSISSFFTLRVFAYLQRPSTRGAS